jgi:hypothetical protein
LYRISHFVPALFAAKIPSKPSRSCPSTLSTGEAGNHARDNSIATRSTSTGKRPHSSTPC